MALDTSTMPVNERADAYMAAMSSTEVPMRIKLHGPKELFSAKLDHWELSAGCRLLRSMDSGTTLIRTERHLNMVAPERLAIGFKLGTPGQTVVGLGNDSMELRPGDMHLNDQTSCSAYSSHGYGGNQAIIIDYDHLGIPIDVVRKAIRPFHTSPIYELFRGHALQLFAIADKIPEDTISRSMLAIATIQIVRAVVYAATGDSSTTRDALHDSEAARVAAYIQQHLKDPSLSAESIARNSHISLRQLYKVWGSNGQTLAQYITSARLEGARQDLARVDLASEAVATIAANWGFTNHPHFSRKFRDAFTTSPQDWRRESLRLS